MPTKKTTLSVAELCLLNVELNSEKGLLSERLPMVFKYHLSKVAKIALEEQTAVDELRNESIRALGKATAEGDFNIPRFIEKSIKDKKEKEEMIPNPSYKTFVEEMEALYSQKRDVDHEVFNIEDIKNVESSGTFPVFFQLLDA